MTAALYWAPQAWLANGWHESVVLRVGADGHWADISPSEAAPPQATVLAGPVLPGLVNAHSHAFQRAFAGMSERRESDHDDFWSWRERMYRVALRIGPDALRAMAAQLYAELLAGGYTQVCEFHYLQHREDGQPYADPLTLSWALADAAAQVGIGLTLLPVLYERAGFEQPTLRAEQRRFAADAPAVRALHKGIKAARRPLVNAGVAVHSLRAARPESITALTSELGDVPIHIHAAEQTAEVMDCLKATGCRPLEWLTRHAGLDARWQLVHATHSTPAEIEAVARSGAGVVLCPSTEANLGDGQCDLPGWLNAGVPLALGSDSHVTRDWAEELRLLEYGQRLFRQQRNTSASAAEPATAARLFKRVLAGGGRAAGFAQWGLQTGARADMLVADAQAAPLLGVPPSHLLDAMVFSSPARLWQDVMVAGHWALRGHQARTAQPIAANFSAAMAALWQG